MRVNNFQPELSARNSARRGGSSLLHLAVHLTDFGGPGLLSLPLRMSFISVTHRRELLDVMLTAKMLGGDAGFWAWTGWLTGAMQHAVSHSCKQIREYMKDNVKVHTWSVDQSATIIDSATITHHRSILKQHSNELLHGKLYCVSAASQIMTHIQVHHDFISYYVLIT